MANASGWNVNVPSGTSRIRDSDDQIRSDKSILGATIEQEHYFSTSSLSAGMHKPGSARVYTGTASQVSVVVDDGRLMWAEDENELYYLSSASTVKVVSAHSHDDLYLKLSSATTSSSTVTGGVHFQSVVSIADTLVATIVSSATTPSTYTVGTLWVKI